MSSASSSNSPTVAVPVRILVQTVTGLVPGDLYLERIRIMRNIICQHFWNRDFASIQERFQARGADFGFDNRACYFLLDSGINLHITQDPPVFWYRWTGDSLLVINKALPTEVLDHLALYPFQQLPSVGLKIFNVDPSLAEQRRMIKAQLHRNMPISEQTILFLRKYPNQAVKLKEDLEPQFWSIIEAFAKSRQGGSRPILPRVRVKKNSKR